MTNNNMKKLILIVILLIVLIFSRNVFASLKINEIYPASPAGENEWIELYNDENSVIDLSQYSLTDLTNKKIKFTNSIVPPLSFEIATSSGVLNNDGDTIFLKNNLGDTIEIASYSGTFDSTKTFAKCPDFNGDWFIFNLSTKNTSNQTACQSLTPTPTIIPVPTLTPTITSASIPTETSTPTPYTLTPTPSIDNVYLSEVMVNPSTREKEWVEIYNNNDFSVSLNNWYIDDLENAGSSPKIFSLSINAKSYGVFDLNSSIFNNDGDSVRLMDFNKNLKDDFEYGKNEQGKTLGRTSFESDDFCLQEPSKNAPNNSCINPTPTPFASPKPTAQAGLTLTSKPTPNNQFMITKNLLSPVGIKSTGQVLGTTNEIIMDAPNNKPLINLLCFLSSSYSLLTIISILFRMKLSYGKDKNFYSPSLHSS